MTYSVNNRWQLLRLPHFRRYALACLLSTFASGFNYVAMTWLVVTHQTSVQAIAILMTCFWLPTAIFGPAGGVMIDRFSRKWTIFWSNVLRALALIIFSYYLQGDFIVNDIYIVSLVLGSIFSLYGPAMMAFVREIVPEHDLLSANSVIDIAYEVGNVVGMGSSGVLIALLSVNTVFIINAGFFFIAGLILLCVQTHYPYISDSVREHSVWKNFKQGLRYILNDRNLMVIYTLQLLIAVEMLTAPVLLAPYAKGVLHANATQFGDIEAALSIGVIIGGLFVPWMANRMGFMRTLFLMIFVLGVSFLLFSFNYSITLAEVLYFLIGFGVAVWPLILTKAQSMTDIAYQGRVQASFNGISSMLILVVYWLIALSSHYIPLHDLYVIQVIFSVIALYLLWVYRKAE